MSMTNGSNGNGRNNASICPSKKKAFGSKEEAQRWEAENQQKYPQLVMQFPYPCDECTSWHLTSMQPDAFGMGKSRQQIAPESMLRNGNATPSRKPKQRYPETLKLEAFRFRDCGLSCKQIAARLDVADYNLKNWLANPELQSKYPILAPRSWRKSTPSSSSSCLAGTVKACSSRRKPTKWHCFSRMPKTWRSNSAITSTGRKFASRRRLKPAGCSPPCNPGFCGSVGESGWCGPGQKGRERK
jgi:hypothetical protein